MGYEDNPSSLFSHYLNDDAFIALPVELGIENLLPRSEVQFPVGDRHDDFVVNDQRFKVSISIVLARLVMQVILAERSQGFEPDVDILNQPALVVIDVNPPR